MFNIKDKIRLEDNSSFSDLGDMFTRIVNALGSAGFGWIIGPMLLSWLPLPEIYQAVGGAMLVAGIFDLMLVVWNARAEIDTSSAKQIKISKRMKDVSLYASTAASISFILYQLAPFVWATSDLATLSAIMTNTRLFLVALTTIVAAVQMIANQKWLSENPDRQRDRQRASQYGTVLDEIVNIEGDILHQVPGQIKNEIAAYMQPIITGMAKQKTAELVSRMGYTSLLSEGETAEAAEVAPPPISPFEEFVNRPIIIPEGNGNRPQASRNGSGHG